LRIYHSVLKDGCSCFQSFVGSTVVVLPTGEDDVLFRLSLETFV
jgi:hypothetical protein